MEKQGVTKMNPFNQAWEILKESKFSEIPPHLEDYTWAHSALMGNFLSPKEMEVYEKLDDNDERMKYLNSRMYTECEECGSFHNKEICEHCLLANDEYTPNPQYEKTRLGNKEFASEKELLGYLEGNSPQKDTQKPHSQFKLTNFGNINAGEEPVMYTHVTGKSDIPSIMQHGLDPEFADVRNQGIWEAEQAKLRKPESAPIYSTNRKHDYHEYSGLLPAIHDMMPEEVRELYDSPTNLTPEEQREAIINAMKPAVFLTQPDTTALRVMAGLMSENNPKVVGVRGMLPPNKLGERNIDETHDAGLPEKISLDKIPPEQLVFYNQKLTPNLGYGMSRELGEPLSIAEDSPVMNMIADYRNLYEQGVVPQPGYFPTQEDYDRYQANRQ